MNSSSSSNSGSSTGWGQNQGKSKSVTGGYSIGSTESRSASTGKSNGANEVIDYQLQPAAFTMLRNGGEEHGGIVDGIVVKAKVWKHSQSVWLPCEFPQG